MKGKKESSCKKRWNNEYDANGTRSSNVTNHEVFEKLLRDQHIANAIEHYNSATYVNGLVAVAQGLQQTDEMQEQRLSTQARRAVNSYIASTREVDEFNSPVLYQLPIWEAAAEFMKAVREQPNLSFAEHALFPLWVLLLGDDLSLHFHHMTMEATHVIEAHKNSLTRSSKNSSLISSLE